MTKGVVLPTMDTCQLFNISLKDTGQGLLLNAGQEVAVLAGYDLHFALKGPWTRWGEARILPVAEAPAPETVLELQVDRRPAGIKRVVE